MPVDGIGNFHKSLPHNAFGEVDQTAFSIFRQVLAHGRTVTDFEGVPPDQIAIKSDKLVNPLAGLSDPTLGPDPKTAGFPTPPDVTSDATAAEMVELLWAALLRDVPFEDWGTDADVAAALAELQAVFPKALHHGGLRLRLDLPSTLTDKLDLTPQTLFRCGLKHENHGPFVSQFFLHDVAYGTQIIVQKQKPYLSKCDYLTDFPNWLKAQNTGFDTLGRGYPDANSAPGDLEGGGTTWRRIATLRDLARFVHKDALHQAYFNAALLLAGWGARLDKGNPYRDKAGRQRGFGSLGGPHLLTLVSEVASRALQLVWFQKWQKHLRLRPEAYGGLMHVQEDGIDAGHGIEKHDYGLPAWLFATAAARRVHHANGTWLLPMAFSSGSPIHPAYGAGHATVAGACVTTLKAWFDEDQPMVDLVKGQTHPLTGKPVRIVQPGLDYGAVDDGTGGKEQVDYAGADRAAMTVGGELNKIAMNVAMGRSFGGVHWRSDNTRSLRLGERLAVEILADMSGKTAERDDFYLEFVSFDGQSVRIQEGRVSVGGGGYFKAAETMSAWPVA